MRALFTTPILEHPAAGGPQLRIENSIKALSQVCDLYVVSRVTKDAMGGEEAESLYSRHCKEFTYAPSAATNNQKRFLRKLTRLVRGAKASKNDAQFILDFVQAKGIDVVWFGYGNISFPLIKEIKRAKPDLKVVCDTDSVWSRFILRELPYISDVQRRAAVEKEGKAKALEEQEWSNLCEVTAAVSEVDAQYYRGLANDPGRIRIFSNVIDLDSYQDPQTLPDGFKQPCMYLAGSFFGERSPMEEAARWTVDNVLPLVKKDIPNIHFYIVGRGSIETLSDIDDSGITITGKLPSVLPYLCNADVALVPLKFESGTRFKIMEAAACGIPIVSTVLGAEGIPVTDGKDIILADEPQEFAAGIVKTIQDKEFAKDLANNCKNLIQKHYSVESLAQEAEAILAYLESR